MTSSLKTALVLTLTLVFTGACAPRIGDTCASNVECNTQEGESCDLSVPEGYCTLFDCIPGDCGEEGVCIEFDEFTATCMLYCDSDADCRQGHVCRQDIAFSATRGGEQLTGGFCFLPAPE